MCEYSLPLASVFFFNDTATTEIYTLSLHDALPICRRRSRRLLRREGGRDATRKPGRGQRDRGVDRKSTRLNSSHANISYAVFCLKKNKSTITTAVSTNSTAEPVCPAAYANNGTTIT